MRADRNARYFPSAVKTGSESTKRPSVTSRISSSASRASRIRLSGCGPGCDQASQAESGEYDSPDTAPSGDCASCRTAPEPMSTTSSRPSRAATATVEPSGAAASSLTSPSSPAASRRGPPAADTSGPPAGATSRLSAPPASLTHTTRPSRPSTRGIRARTPGSTARARAGPSRWVSQCTVPRTSIALARPV